MSWFAKIGALAQPFMTAPIIGANSELQVAGSLAAVGLAHSQEQIERLTNASAWQEA